MASRYRLELHWSCYGFCALRNNSLDCGSAYWWQIFEKVTPSASVRESIIGTAADSGLIVVSPHIAITPARRAGVRGETRTPSNGLMTSSRISDVWKFNLASRGIGRFNPDWRDKQMMFPEDYLSPTRVVHCSFLTVNNHNTCNHVVFCLWLNHRIIIIIIILYHLFVNILSPSYSSKQRNSTKTFIELFMFCC